MTSRKDLKEIERYKDYPEGSGGKKIYDSVFLPFPEYLKKYYKNPDMSSWNRWHQKYIQYAYDKVRYVELVERFGYAKIEFHDFEAQYEVYKFLQGDMRLDEETRKFIGFMAGTKFFEKHDITVLEWFNMPNWANPSRRVDEGKTINEILNSPYGLNMLKTSLPHLDHWRR